MWSQIVTIFGLIAVATALPAISHQSRVDGLGFGYIGHGLSRGYNDYVYNHGYYNAYPSYKFAYSVYDPYTGDHKSHAEYRQGDIVKGSYSLAEPGGHMRSVHYSADDIHGFNAAVHHSTIHHYIPHHHY